MIRLVEARARAELREEVTQEDAEVRHGSGGHLDASRRQPQDVVELMRTSLYDLYLDDRGVVDFRRGGGRSQQAEAKRFLGALARQAQELHNDGLFSLEDLYALADKMELQVHSTDEFLSSLNDAGTQRNVGTGWIDPSVSVDQICRAPCVTRLGRALLTHTGACSTHHTLKTCLPKQTRGINAEKAGGCLFYCCPCLPSPRGAA